MADIQVKEHKCNEQGNLEAIGKDQIVLHSERKHYGLGMDRICFSNYEGSAYYHSACARIYYNPEVMFLVINEATGFFFMIDVCPFCKKDPRKL
jgi:hypothetical protein